MPIYGVRLRKGTFFCAVLSALHPDNSEKNMRCSERLKAVRKNFAMSHVRRNFCAVFPFFEIKLVLGLFDQQMIAVHEVSLRQHNRTLLLMSRVPLFV